MEEYICKNSVGQKPITVRLLDFQLEWQCGEASGSISYANIIFVQLTRMRSRFKIRIKSDYQGSIILTNRFYLTSSEFEDRSRQYNTFVRVLHFHLKNSVATFSAGTARHELILVTSIMVVATFSLQWLIIQLSALATPYYWFIAFNIVLFAVAALLIFRKYPKPYLPESIPMECLP